MNHLIITIFFAFFFHLTLFAQENERALAEQYMQQGEVQKAADIYQKLYQSKRESYYDSYLNSLIQLKKFDEAETITKQMQQAHPKEFQYDISLGRIYEEKGNQQQAVEIFSKVLKDMPANEKTINNTARLFSRIKNTDFVIRTYIQGRMLLNDDRLFAIELGNRYRELQNKQEMLNEYMKALSSDPKYLPEIKRNIASMLETEKDTDLLKTVLQNTIKQYPENLAYADLTAWQYLQRGEFGAAIKEGITLNKKQKNSEKNIIELCETLAANGAYDEANQGYEYLISLGKTNPYYTTSRIALINTKNKKLTASKQEQNQLINLEQEYQALITELGKNKTTAQSIVDLARLQAFQLKNSKQAEKTLSELVTITDLPTELMSEAKLELGDLYLINGKQWDATLAYGQVEKAFPGKPAGLEAQFRNAKLAYYIGDFTWSKNQLEDLTAKTAEYIDNDALNLWLMINDHTAFDSTANALKLYAHADFLIFKQDTETAINTLDSIDKKFPVNDLANDILMAKARIFLLQYKFSEAISSLTKIYAENAGNVWADDAVFLLGDIYQHHLHDNTNAQNWYQKLITQYPGSLWVNEARKRFRSIRGDNTDI